MIWCHSLGTQTLLPSLQPWEGERGPAPHSYLLGEAIPQLLQGTQHFIDVKHTDHLDPLQSLQLWHKGASPTASRTCYTLPAPATTSTLRSHHGARDPYFSPICL